MNLPLREQRQGKQPIGPKEGHDAHGQAERGGDIQRFDLGRLFPTCLQQAGAALPPASL